MEIAAGRLAIQMRPFYLGKDIGTGSSKVSVDSVSVNLSQAATAARQGWQKVSVGEVKLFAQSGCQPLPGDARSLDKSSETTFVRA